MSFCAPELLHVCIFCFDFLCWLPKHRMGGMKDNSDPQLCIYICPTTALAWRILCSHEGTNARRFSLVQHVAAILQESSHKTMAKLSLASPNQTAGRQEDETIREVKQSRTQKEYICVHVAIIDILSKRQHSHAMTDCAEYGCELSLVKHVHPD